MHSLKIGYVNSSRRFFFVKTGLLILSRYDEKVGQHVEILTPAFLLHIFPRLADCLSGLLIPLLSLSLLFPGKSLVFVAVTCSKWSLLIDFV